MTTPTDSAPAARPATSADDQAAPDVVSDPAKDDTQGQDWSDEGGATATCPATATAEG